MQGARGKLLQWFSKALQKSARLQAAHCEGLDFAKLICHTRHCPRWHRATNAFLETPCFLLLLWNTRHRYTQALEILEHKKEVDSEESMSGPLHTQEHQIEALEKSLLSNRSLAYSRASRCTSLMSWSHAPCEHTM
eukprot:scaffold246923_cov24-Tisochrysis_lutea.AAC.2